MTLMELAQKLRPLIEKAAGSLSDADALEGVQLFPAWAKEHEYKEGDRVRYNATLFRCLKDHTAQDTWKPADAPSLWAKVLIPDPDVIPAWEQPDSTNAYKLGDKVTHDGKTWVCTAVDGGGNNTWMPGVYGWSEVN